MVKVRNPLCWSCFVVCPLTPQGKCSHCGASGQEMLAKEQRSALEKEKRCPPNRGTRSR